MTVIRCVVLLCAALVTSHALGAGFSYDKNFIVLSDDQKITDGVLAKANEYRREIAKEWLGQELPEGVVRTTIHVEISGDEDRAFTWPVDPSDGGFHKTWLVTSREKALGTTLHHEIAHSVLNSRNADPLPVFIEEGIASQYDDPVRRARAPARPVNLSRLLASKSIPARDQDTYAAASSLVEFLLTKGSKKRVVEFAMAGKAQGWDAALRQHYRIESVSELEHAWQAWMKQTAQTSRSPVRTSDSRLEGTARLR